MNKKSLFIYNQLIFFPLNIYFLGWIIGSVFFIIILIQLMLKKWLSITIAILINISLLMPLVWSIRKNNPDWFINLWLCAGYNIGLLLYAKIDEQFIISNDKISARNAKENN